MASSAICTWLIYFVYPCGSLGGFVGPYGIGLIKGQGYAATTGLLLLAALLVMSFFMTVFICVREHAPSA